MPTPSAGEGANIPFYLGVKEQHIAGTMRATVESIHSFHPK